MFNQTNSCLRLRNHFVHLINSFNLYDHDDSLTRAEQILSTRIFIVFLSISLYSVLTITAVLPQTRTITLVLPSPNEFNNVVNEYKSTPTCRCSQVSISYEQFFSLDSRFHQVCSSDFITEQWFSSLFNENTSSYHPLDFRLTASAQFQVLAVLCTMSRETVLHAQEQFLSTQFITLNALSKFDFDTYTAALIDQLNKTTVAQFYADNHFISSIIDQYQYTSALRTNFYTISIPGSSSYTNFPTVYPTQANLDQSSFISNGTCSCDVTSNCAYPAGIYNHSMSIVPNEIFLPDASLLFSVTGFKIGCVSQNALLQSTLECLYNQSCLNMFVALTAAITTVAPLNMSSSSRFLPTTTIELMFKNLMLESWEGFTNFSEYFRTCAPKACSYSYVQRFNFIYMMTTLISLYGGMSVVFQTMSPLFVKFILRKCRQQVEILETNEHHEQDTSKVD